MTTLEDVRKHATHASLIRFEAQSRRDNRDESIRQCYRAGNATLAELAKATGLSKQRIHVIVKDGEDMQDRCKHEESTPTNVLGEYYCQRCEDGRRIREDQALADTLASLIVKDGEE